MPILEVVMPLPGSALLLLESAICYMAAMPMPGLIMPLPVVMMPLLDVVMPLPDILMPQPERVIPFFMSHDAPPLQHEWSFLEKNLVGQNVRTAGLCIHRLHCGSLCPLPALRHQLAAEGADAACGACS